MSEDLKGQIGSSGAGYEVQVDNQLNVSLSLSDTMASGPLAGASASVQIKVPLVAILDAAAAASKNATVEQIEGGLKLILEQYEASKAPVAP